MMLLLVRHASAGERDEWSGDDRLRPLDARGRRQAVELVSRLDRFPIARILSSPCVRCVQTVEPLARACRLVVEERVELGEDLQDPAGALFVRELVAAGEVAAVSGHRELSELLVRKKQRKGETFVLEPGDDGLQVVDVIH